MQRSITQFLAETDDWILLDGPMGTRLAELGYHVDNQPGWSAQALVDVPDLVRQVHAEYVGLGAMAITANTFRLHAANLAKWGRSGEAENLTQSAVELARQAAGELAWVLGSQAPVGDCYRPDETPTESELRAAHRQMAFNLKRSGVDAVLLETHVSQREVLIALEAAAEAELPAIASVVCRNETELLDGTLLAEFAEQARQFSPLALGVNCVPVERIGAALKTISARFSGPLIAYGNTGEMTQEGVWNPTAGNDPERHAKIAATWFPQGLRILGGCCGCGPAWIEKFSRLARPFDG